MKKHLLLMVIISLGIMGISQQRVLAQVGEPEFPFYIVKEGDVLWDIAARLGISVEDLVGTNSLIDANILATGTRLEIPGLIGYSGEIDTIQVAYGETLRSISRRMQVPVDILATLNRISSPNGLYAGYNLIVPAEMTGLMDTAGNRVTPLETLLETALIQDENPWTLILENDLPGSWAGLQGDVLVTSRGQNPGPGALPGYFEDIDVSLPVVQGKTLVVNVQSSSELELRGSLNGWELEFYPTERGYAALQGVHAFSEPGLYPLTIAGGSSNPALYPEGIFTFTQSIVILGGNYPFDPALTVPPETIDPAITEPEDALWESLGTPTSPEKLWAGRFQSPVPVDFEQCWTSNFGNRRSYNGSPFHFFHSGLDFCGGVGTELYAPAAGKVVFAEPLVVRGNATVIDHGWGVYTAYDHQSEIFVKPGDIVQPGQLIGLGGATGRVTGPHLHWEVWVGGVQVDPIDWLENIFP